MIIDRLENVFRCNVLNAGIAKAFAYLQSTDLAAIVPGRYEIDGDNIFAIVQEYQTVSAEAEQVEAHKKYIDVQYMISGAEMIGHAILQDQIPSQVYEDTTDFMLFSEVPSFFSILETGMFMIFYPTDLHMPCIKINEPATVKKVVIKVKVEKVEKSSESKSE